MHQANGDTRLCTACIDHVDLVAIGRGAPRRTDGTGERSKAWRGTTPSHPFLRSTGFSLSRARCSRTAQMYGPNEIYARKRTELSAETLAREYVYLHAAHERLLASTCLYVRACVFFNEIYYRTPNASGHEERVLPLFPPIHSLSPCSTAIAITIVTVTAAATAIVTATTVANVVALVVAVVALVVIVAVAASCRCRCRRPSCFAGTSYLLTVPWFVFARRLIPGCLAITS